MQFSDHAAASKAGLPEPESPSMVRVMIACAASVRRWPSATRGAKPMPSGNCRAIRSIWVHSAE